MNGIFVFYLQLGLDFGSDLRILSFSVPEQSYKAHDKKKLRNQYQEIAQSHWQPLLIFKKEIAQSLLIRVIVNFGIIKLYYES
jgi:hypothetical protein